MGFTQDLLAGLARKLDADTSAVFKATDPYATNEVGIVFGVPTQDPPSLIALGIYNNSDDPALSDSRPMVQVRVRGPHADPAAADDLADEVFNSLQGFRGDLPNGIHVTYASRNSTFPLGIDSNGRQERTDNYDLTVYRPSAHRE